GPHPGGAGEDDLGGAGVALLRRAPQPGKRGGAVVMQQALHQAVPHAHAIRPSARLAAARPQARAAGARTLTAQALGRAATLALHDELALSPKPGLVTLASQGSHSDMDAHTFMRSLFALRSYFVRIAGLGEQGAGFDALERCGIEAEARMLAATGGINT